MQTVTYYNSSKTQHPRTTFWKTAWEARTTHQSTEIPELDPRSPDTLSLSPTSPLLSFSQKMVELVYAGIKLSASPQISTKKWQAPQPPKTAGSALPPPPVRALRPLPQRQGPNPPPSAVGEPKTTDNSSQ